MISGPVIAYSLGGALGAAMILVFFTGKWWIRVGIGAFLGMALIAAL